MDTEIKKELETLFEELTDSDRETLKKINEGLQGKSSIDDLDEDFFDFIHTEILDSNNLNNVPLLIFLPDFIQSRYSSELIRSNAYYFKFLKFEKLSSVEVKEAVLLHGLNLEHIKPENQSKDLCLFACWQNPQALQFVSHEMFKNQDFCNEILNTLFFIERDIWVDYSKKIREEEFNEFNELAFQTYLESIFDMPRFTNIEGLREVMEKMKGVDFLEIKEYLLRCVFDCSKIPPKIMDDIYKLSFSDLDIYKAFEDQHESGFDFEKDDPLYYFTNFNMTSLNRSYANKNLQEYAFIEDVVKFFADFETVVEELESEGV